MRALWIAAFTCSAFAQTPPDAPPQANDGVIVATVVNTRGEPLSGAWVSLQGDIVAAPTRKAVRHAAADDAGRARFRGLPNGYYHFAVRMAGHESQAQTQSVTLQGEHAEAEVRLVLGRKPVLTGRVLDPAGRPLERADIKLLRRLTRDGVAEVKLAGATMTDDRGVYRVALREPGRYWLMVSHSEQPFPRGSAPLLTGVTFYPNAPDLASAMPLELDFDQPERELDIPMLSAPATSLRMAIASGPSNAPCGGCRYALRRVEGSLEYDIVSGHSGRQQNPFEYGGIPAGAYRIYVADQGMHQGWWGVGETTVVEGRQTEGAIATQPPIAISGRLVFEGEPQQLQDLPPELPKTIQVQFNRERSESLFGGMRSGQDTVELEPDAREFHFDPMPPAIVQPHVWLRGANSYIASIKRDGRPLPSASLDLMQPGPWDNLEITVRFDPAQVRIEIEGELPKLTAQPPPIYTLLIEPDLTTNPFGRRQTVSCGAALAACPRLRLGATSSWPCQANPALPATTQTCTTSRRAKSSAPGSRPSRSRPGKTPFSK
ncbi:MAG: carboxypeptidase-like regulatory domain-containing protein [Bryobacterales bacterium]